jgi:hypothetical protein
LQSNFLVMHFVKICILSNFAGCILVRSYKFSALGQLTLNF